jgi:hypothetical protein
LGDPIDGGDDRLAAGHGERPARAKIVLHIDDQQHVAVGNLHRKVHSRPSRATGAERTSPVSIFPRCFATTEAVRRSARMHPVGAGMQRFGLIRVD